MPNLSRKAMAIVLALPLFVLAGCASQADLDALRDEVTKSQELAQNADQSAAASAAEARRAADEAKAASEKADRIYQQSLRK